MQTEEEKEERDCQPDSGCSSGFLVFETLRKKSDFEKLRKEGKVFRSKYLVLYILPRKGQQKLRAGFGTGKKIGKAFQRNKIRRILKEVLRKVSIPFGIDVFIIARKAILDIGYYEVKEELEKYLNRIFQTNSQDRVS